VTDDIQARFEDIERRLAALEAAPREPAPMLVGGVPEWLQPLDEIFKSGNPITALAEADRLRAEAYAASSTTRLQELQAYLRGVVQYPKLARVMSAINRNLVALGGDAGEVRGGRRTDLRPFPPSNAAPPAVESVPAAGDDAGDAGVD